MRAMQAHDEGPRERGNQEFCAQTESCGHTIGALFGDFRIIVEKPEKGVGHRDRQHHPDIGIPQVGEQQGSEEQPNPDQKAAHGRRALLGHLRFQRQITDRLPLALASAKHVNHPATKDHRYKKGSHQSQPGAEG